MRAKEFKNQVKEKIKDLVFPEKPIVSEKTKSFIKSCLTNNVTDRPDIFKAWELFNQVDDN